MVGASRGTGAEVVSQAVAAGHHVRAVARWQPPGGPGVRLFAVDATDPSAIRPAIVGADAVIVTVGAPARQGQTPRADITRSVIAAMTEAGVTRLVAQSSYGAGDSYDSMPLVGRRVLAPIVLKHALADHDAQEALLSASGLDWTVIRPGGLAGGGATGTVRLAAGDGSSGSLGRVSRGDVAAMLLGALDDPSTIGHAFTIIKG